MVFWFFLQFLKLISFNLFLMKTMVLSQMNLKSASDQLTLGIKGRFLDKRNFISLLSLVLISVSDYWLAFLEISDLQRCAQFIPSNISIICILNLLFSYSLEIKFRIEISFNGNWNSSKAEKLIRGSVSNIKKGCNFLFKVDQ